MLIFKNNKLKIIFKNNKFFVFLNKQIFFVQFIHPLKQKEYSFCFWLFYILKFLYSFGLFTFNKSYLKKVSIKVLK